MRPTDLSFDTGLRQKDVRHYQSVWGSSLDKTKNSNVQIQKMFTCKENR